MSIAFFDLDKTLLADNSAKLWLKAQWDLREINLWQMVNASYWLAKYHLGFTKMDVFIEGVLTMIAGERESFVLERTAAFFRSTIRDLYRPGALKSIKAHRRRGHAIALLTSTFDGLSSMVQQDLGLDHCLCTRLEVDAGGRYTGKTLGPPCFGKNKVIFAEELCKDLGVSLARCSFYTDSASDIPLLSLVGNPVAVNPDPHLRARAQIKQWPIVDWGRPTR